MRKLSIICLIIFEFGFAQSKNTTEIILKDVGAKEELIKLFVSNENYIESEKYGVVTTVLRNSKSKPNWSHQYMYRIVFDDTNVTIKPYWTMGLTIDLGSVNAEAQLEKWHFSKGKNINGFIFIETMEMLKNGGYSDIDYN
jgi:hypothetical protein